MKPTPTQTPQQQQECHLDELGFHFVKKCIENIESRGLDDQGLYRIGGVNSRVARLLQMCLDRKNFNQTTGHVTMPDFSDSVEWETKTITSALKNYLRNLSEPLMTHRLHPAIIEAAKIESADTRTNRIKNLIQKLPARNFTMLKVLVGHLRNVANHSKKNLMTVSNLGICFAPTLMRGPEENSLSIVEIKYSNVVANTLIEEYDSIFNQSRMFQQTNQNFHTHHHPHIQHHGQQHQQAIEQRPEDKFGPIGLLNAMNQSNQQQVVVPIPNFSPINNNNNKQYIEYHNGSNDLAQFALTSRPATFNSLAPEPPIELKPLNDLKTYPYDHNLMVQVENQLNHHKNHLGGSMNNSLDYLPNYHQLGSQTSSFPNSLNYSSGSLNNGNLNDQFGNNQNVMNSFPYNRIYNNNKLRSGKVITLYACIADNESELSFGPNELITDVQSSVEVGWLVGTLDRSGQRGLLPENYVKFI